MKKFYGENELRRMYLEFFESKGHLKMNSFSLVPHNDNSLLLINAGMAPLKPYFTGQEIPPRRRVTTCQKCIRTGDIENVGKTARHLTFFEMLGNFSFGDYFKHEAIAWSWEFLTKVLGLEEDRLYPSIYGEDDEAFDIWTKEVGVPAERITRFYRDPRPESVTISGSMAQVHAVRAPRSIMTAEKNTAAVSRTARSAVTVTALWKCGTTYLPSLRVMARVVILNFPRRISIPVWDLSVLRLSCRMWIPYSTLIR